MEQQPTREAVDLMIEQSMSPAQRDLVDRIRAEHERDGRVLIILVVVLMTVIVTLL